MTVMTGTAGPSTMLMSFFETLAQERFPLDAMISHEFAPLECGQAYALAERERHQVMGILFDWTTTERSNDSQ